MTPTELETVRSFLRQHARPTVLVELIDAISDDNDANEPIIKMIAGVLVEIAGRELATELLRDLMV